MIDLTYNGIINTSIEIGELVYYTGAPDSVGGGGVSFLPAEYNTTDNDNGVSTPFYMGFVSSITTNINVPNFTIQVWEASNVASNIPLSGNYIFFAKDNQVGLSTMKGYYNEVVFENNSTAKAEMFATSCEITSSSK